MNKKKVTGIIAVAAIVVIILIAAGSKKQSPAPEELTGADRTEEAANSGNGAVDTGIRPETGTQAESNVSTAPETSVDTSASSGTSPAETSGNQ
ncbi:hypothetical protein [Alistipes indistinctus]|jgi:hypothetical protein|uniref:hypothetical protein n=1 Tax=Alistipes indistinctus TaxID=626932 RepID=UPI0026700FCE|nr:hypothetical protein [Alistipes indistinctus]